MSVPTWSALVWALLGVPIAALSSACVEDDELGPTAGVGVVMNGVTTEAEAVVFVLEPAAYDFSATGSADADGADITVTVKDRQGGEVATAGFSLTLAEANASPGDSGSGANTGVLLAPGMQSVSIDFRWQGSTPSSEALFTMHFFDNPDIVGWTASPRPPVSPTTLVHVVVDATNNEGPPEEMTVVAQFIDEVGGGVLDAVVLSLDSDGLFKGDLEAPAYPGDHRLRILATDNTGGTTQHERIHTVR